MSPSLYRNVLLTAQYKMSASIEQIRQSIPHSGEVGDLIERVFRRQLLDLLPEKVGVSNGFVVDSQGGVSRQMDIILYDRLNTPRIFSSKGAQMFPVESTYACGEIKTNMNSNQLRDSFDKCLSYKRLTRKAYYSPSNPILQRTYSLFGCNFEHWQSIFFCIAAHSVSANTLLSTFKENVETRSLPVHERVDILVALKVDSGGNMLLNGKVEPGSNIPQDKSIDLLPNSESSICSYRANEPWSLFVMLLLGYLVQAPTEPVNMLLYGSEDPY